MIQFEPLATAVTFTSSSLKLTLAGDREVSAPLAWFPRLLNATEAQRNHWRFIGRGIGVHWPEIDEDVSVESLMAL